MHRYLPVLVVLLGLLTPAAFVAAQDAPDPDATPSEVDDETAAGEDESADIDPELDAELEIENYADAEEEDFVPTEDIPADQAIPFPTDI